MLLTQDHLKQQEEYFENLVRWYTLDATDRYGLMRKSSATPAVTIVPTIRGNRLIVEVRQCQALTPGGHYIEITEGSGKAPAAEISPDDGAIAVYVAVDPKARQETGQPDPDEDLPRLPFLSCSYSVHLGDPPNRPQSEYLQVGLLHYINGEVSYADDYFPPCVTLGADERLAARTVDFRNRLENLLSLASRAYSTLSAEGALAGESTRLKTQFVELLGLLVYHLASTIDSCIPGRNASHPMHLVVFFKRLFRVFTTLLNLRPGVRDYLNEKLFTRELSTPIDQFVAGVESFLMAQYDHEDIGGQLRTTNDILTTLRDVFGFLAQMKEEDTRDQAMATDSLTYRGRTYRVAEYNSCRLEQMAGLSYLLVDLAEPTSVSDAVVLVSKDIYTAAQWSAIQVRLGLNEARGLGETDPADVDVVTYGNKVAFHPSDMASSSSVGQMTLIMRGVPDVGKLEGLGKMDLIVYTV
ncbi:MAG: hypothetical protein ACE5FH_10180 [Candidatus Zixiibacteriota bacterium]